MLQLITLKTDQVCLTVWLDTSFWNLTRFLPTSDQLLFPNIMKYIFKNIIFRKFYEIFSKRINRSLGALRGPTSSWQPFGNVWCLMYCAPWPLVLRPWDLRRCIHNDPRCMEPILIVVSMIHLSMRHVSVMHVSINQYGFRHFVFEKGVFLKHPNVPIMHVSIFLDPWCIYWKVHKSRMVHVSVMLMFESMYLIWCCWNFITSRSSNQ